MRTKMMFISGLLSVAVSAVLAAPTQAVTVLANGGAYFRASGPIQYWHFDAGEGYCGHLAAWCSPNHQQWTYSMDPLHATNSASWSVPTPVSYYSAVYAFVPRRDATALAFYTTGYGYVSSRQSSVDQNAYYDQWVALNGGQKLYRVSGVTLSDNNQWFGRSGVYRVAFDEIKIEN